MEVDDRQDSGTHKYLHLSTFEQNSCRDRVSHKVGHLVLYVIAISVRNSDFAASRSTRVQEDHQTKEIVKL